MKTSFLTLSLSLLFVVLASLAKGLGLGHISIYLSVGIHALWITLLYASLYTFKLNQVQSDRLLPRNDQLLLPILLLWGYFIFRAGILQNFSPSSLRRLLPLFFFPHAYLIFQKASSAELKQSSLMAIPLYLIFFWHHENIQIAIIHLGLFGFLALSSRGRLNIGIFLLLFAGAIMTKSLGALLAIAACCATLFIPLRTNRLKIAIGAIPILIFLSQTFLSTNSIGYRLDFWKEGLSTFLNHPLFGGGLGHQYIILSDRIIPHAHNIFISILAESGILGGALVFFLVYRILRYWSKYPPELQSGLIGITAWSLFDEPLYWAAPLMLTAAILSQCTQYSLKDHT